MKMRRNDFGMEILKVKPLISKSALNLPVLSKLSDDSFGKEYANFMEVHDFNADDRAPIKFIHDDELAYIMLRYRQIHDFWHVLAGLPPTVLGEIALKCFELKIVSIIVLCDILFIH